MENIYHPFTEAEYIQMKEDAAGIKSFLPSHLMGIFWIRCQAIRGTKEPQPCGCPSAAGLWGGCVDTINDFIKQKESEQQTGE